MDNLVFLGNTIDYFGDWGLTIFMALIWWEIRKSVKRGSN